ncbi:MAG TPA: TetR/AcrR family transcriptional regulator [Gaiellaceae bacterium]|jgi:AcrR family transcriptional regulator|nr:TetR/AcrR family transcriptional regulator [Gaiellaceae bacterium]
MRITDLPPAKNSAPRERLLETAARIFYAEGINTVGVDRIVKEAGVTLATFYRHFPSKQHLILAYLQRAHDGFDSLAAAAREAATDPPDMLRLIGNNITAQLFEPNFRGCAFINAASEFEDPDGPIMRAVLTHRSWFHALVRDTFASAGHPQPDLAASRYVMLRDGATTAGYLGDPSQAREAFDSSAAELLRFIDQPDETGDPAADPTPPEATRTSTMTSAQSH